jgi:hypothetical protein
VAFSQSGEVVIPRERWEAYARIVRIAERVVHTPREWRWLLAIELWRLGREVQAAKCDGHLRKEANNV